MKILLVAGPFISLREPYNGGTEAFIVAHANQLVGMGHEVDVIAKDADEKNQFQVIEFPESPLSMKDDAYRPCPEWLGQQHYQSFQYAMFDVYKYDVVHYHSFIPEIYAIGTLFNVPAVLTLHLPPEPKFELMYKLFIRQTKVVPISISRRMSERWGSSFGRNPEIILNGVVTEQWHWQDRNADGYLLWSGRIAKEKNVEAAIELAKNLKKPLMIVGPVFNQQYFQDFVQPHLSESIRYLAHVSQHELNELAGGASAYLATAIWEEPFGLSIIEMLASGVPVAGFSTAIPAELRNENVSIAVDSKDWKDLIEPLKTLKHATSQACRVSAESFHMNITSGAYVDVYERVIKNV